MSTVYLANHEMLERYCAIKEVCRDGSFYYEELRQSLIREINILKKLDHPGLPKVLDVVIKKDILLIIMEYIEGNTLKELYCMKGKLKEKEVLAWGKQICEILFYLHTRTPPIIYRDLKPSNLMLRSDDRVTLIDFGTAKEYQKTLSKTNSMSFGTKGYAAPEQYRNDIKIDERTDIYCFGATMYYLLTGKEPERRYHKGVSLRCWNPELSEGLETIVIKCMKENPAERYQNCMELQYAMEHLEKNTKEYRNREKKKIQYFFILITGVLLFGAAALICRQRLKYLTAESAMIYIRQAEKSLDKNYVKANYEAALQIMPEEARIYKSLANTYIRVNDFTMDKAAELMNILETAEKNSAKPVLEILCQKDAGAYCSFCYDVGIGYFYYMNNVAGKKEAEVWFEEVCRIKTNKFSEDKRKRAFLYKEISGYYNTFIKIKEDKSGEKEAKGYKDFFRTLCKLNQIDLTLDSTVSEASAAYLISSEIAVEIGNFAIQFLEKGEVPVEKLQKELDKIDSEGEYEKSEAPEERIEILKKFKNKEEIDNLKELVKTAKKKIVLAEIRKI